MRILIADDSPQVRCGLRKLLEQWSSFDICEAVDGLDAIEKAKKQEPDLIILDLSMPRMNGLDAARELRAEMAHVPIIVFTMYAGAVLPSQLAQSGISALVSKEDARELVTCIDSMLGTRSENPSAQPPTTD
jgi:DNA-binding NarL/FixJ family response regulator